MKVKLILAACASVALIVGGSAALGAPSSQTGCGTGSLAAGTYNGLVVTGTCTVKSAVTVNGNVTVAEGAYLDAAYLATELTINGNVHVGKGAKLGLGCTFGYHDCGLDPTVWSGRVTVNGNIVADQALTMFLDFTTIHGNVVSNGGGDITMVDPNGLVLPIKDNVVDGNIIVAAGRARGSASSATRSAATSSPPTPSARGSATRTSWTRPRS